ncbi:MAG: NAD(P)H-binding protein [Streptosporangiaceae bacterium]
MRVFLAGATGVLGMRLVPLLVAAGHDVAGMTRTPAKTEQLQAMGAEPVVCDVFNRDALCEAVVNFGADMVLDELTDLPDDPARIPELAWQIPGDGGAAVEEHERTILDAGGVVIRYGQFYGTGTYFESELPPPPRIHVDAAARRTMSALDEPSGVVIVADDRP